MSSQEYIIETNGLVKRYGKLTAVDNLSIQVPNAGEAYVAGYSVIDFPREVRRAIGYMPDFFGVYDDMKVWEYLDFFAACYEIPERERPNLINDPGGFC